MAKKTTRSIVLRVQLNDEQKRSVQKAARKSKQKTRDFLMKLVMDRVNAGFDSAKLVSSQPPASDSEEEE